MAKYKNSLVDTGQVKCLNVNKRNFIFFFLSQPSLFNVHDYCSDLAHLLFPFLQASPISVGECNRAVISEITEWSADYVGSCRSQLLSSHHISRSRKAIKVINVNWKYSVRQLPSISREGNIVPL